MLSVNEYNYIKLLYDKLLKTNNYISELMKKNEWESVEFAVADKDTLMKQIMQFEKVHKENIKANHELFKFRQSIVKLEKDNIELLKSLREETKKELSGVSKSKRVLNTYEPTLIDGFSTIDVSDED